MIDEPEARPTPVCDSHSTHEMSDGAQNFADSFCLSEQKAGLPLASQDELHKLQPPVSQPVELSNQPYTATKTTNTPSAEALEEV